MVSRAATGLGRGFALVDVLAASILLGVTLAVVFGIAGRALGAQKLGEELQVASMLADEQLNLVLAHGPDDYARRFPTDGACEEPFEKFAYELDIDGGSESTPYLVGVTILWRSGSIERSVRVETLMASRLGDDPDPDRAPIEPVERYY